VDVIFAELFTSRRREVMSAVAHYIAGGSNERYRRISFRNRRLEARRPR
jgi:hypothetical protein